MKLCLVTPKYYRVKRGQTLSEVAETFHTTPRLLVLKNNLTAELWEGQILELPPAGNLYRVRGGESRSMLCGSMKAFEEKNGTRRLYVGQTVVL